MKIEWTASPLASSLHAAAACVREQAVANRELGDALAGPAAALVRTFSELRLDASRTMGQLQAMASAATGNDESPAGMVDRALADQGLPDSALEAIAAAVENVVAAMRGAVPQLEAELALRRDPLRWQWEAHGPGLLASIGRLTDLEMVPQCRVVLAFPILGGGGCAYLPEQTVALEAVLFNPFPELPEVLRLSWLISQLGRSRPEIAQFALLPAVLTAAEQQQLAPCSEESLANVLAAWRIATGDETKSVAAILARWWQDHVDQQISFSDSSARLAGVLP